jgi:hypothetical protein
MKFFFTRKQISIGNIETIKGRKYYIESRSWSINNFFAMDILKKERVLIMVLEKNIKEIE